MIGALQRLDDRLGAGGPPTSRRYRPSGRQVVFCVSGYLALLVFEVLAVVITGEWVPSLSGLPILLGELVILGRLFRRRNLPPAPHPGPDLREARKLLTPR